ncbi:MAG: alpha/beta hydrolase [Synergistaceae bacterium]|jgi:pimeloyl-ACP methyl ester carboxylesterase|nr:alpha/beta hydrolase [Synergistaceae bacterium]
MRVNGLNINYYDKGSGEAVVFLHGWGSEFSVFREFLDGLSGYYRTCSLDLPGFGGSDEPPSGWSVGDYADFVLDFLAALGICSAVLVGHSFGGRIVIKLTGMGEGRLDIKKIILIDSAGIRAKRTARQKMKSAVYSLGKRVLSMGVVQKKYPRCIDGWRLKNSSEDYRNASSRMRECLAKIVTEDLTHCLPSISCPALLVWGENDTDTPVSDAGIMERMIPDAGLVIMKDAGHYSFLDQRYTFGRVLDSFLNITRLP